MPCREFLLREDRDVVEELEGEMVGDEILCREPVIVRVPVEELFPHGIEFLLLGQVIGFLPEEDVVEDLGSEQLGIDLTDLVGDRVIRHVDRRIRERLDRAASYPTGSGCRVRHDGCRPSP